MKRLIKLILLVAIVVFALWNYRYLSFDKGFSKTQMEDDFSSTISTIVGIKKVEYYENTIQNEYKYKVYIVTNEDAYLLNATQEDIDSFSLLGIFSDNIQPEKITPIPFYVEIVVGLIIIFFPTGKKKKKESA